MRKPRYMNFRFDKTYFDAFMLYATLPAKMEEIYGDFHTGDTALSTLAWFVENSHCVGIVDSETNSLMAFGGMQPLWSGVARAWVCPMVDIKPAERCTRRLVKTCRDVLATCVREWRLHRVEAVVLAGWDTGLEFAEHFGFKPECVLKQFSSTKRDYVQFAQHF